MNPESKKLENSGFEIFIGDQSSEKFWKKFFKKVGKIDILIDDGGHTNLQQITTLMQSIPYIKNGGSIIVEDTHTSFMNYKGFKNPSKNSFISFSTKLIENLHRRNPMLKKKINQFSNKISSIEYFDSIVCINISKKKLKMSKNIENNKNLRNLFSDYRFKKTDLKSDDANWLIKKIFSKISRKGLIYKLYENLRINSYLKKIKN